MATMSAIASVTAFTHRGRVRAGNEDTIVVGDWVSAPDMAAPRIVQCDLSAPVLCAVCDGMGGHRAGEVASRHVAQRLSQERSRIGDAGTAAAVLADIDAELYRRMAEDSNLLGMGTTVAGLMLAPRLIWFNVGDSRIYRQRGGGLEQVSIDDTPPGPRSGVITQSLGGALPPAEIAPHCSEEVLVAPARFLLCSDGLSDMLDDAEIAECLKHPDAEAVAQLFGRAMDAGGHDNISIVLASVQEPAGGAPAG
jgi:serine/threonine protein phosphatase PrpC